MVASITEAVNLALSTLGEPGLTDVAVDTGTTAKECRRWLDVVRQRELMAFDWPFTIVRTSIVKDAVDPAFGWVSRYAIPADCLRFLPVTDNGEEFGNPVGHENEGGFILVDKVADLRLRYVKDEGDVTKWSANFVEVFIASLAVTLAENLTGLSQALSTASSRYEQALSRGHRYEMRQQGTPVSAYSSAWVEERT